MSHPRTILVVATRNDGKFKEIQNVFKDLSLTLKSLKDFPSIGEIQETGDTFSENALIKARAVHHVTGNFVLADDSGLESEDLGGAPGIYSARYAGPKATDEENNQKLVQAIQALRDPCCKIRYVCALSVIDPHGKEAFLEETCEGLITFSPKGEGGFGYDPYFYIPAKGCTMAELALDEKNKISHRGKALQKAKLLLQERLKLA